MLRRPPACPAGVIGRMGNSYLRSLTRLSRLIKICCPAIFALFPTK
ncbi:hypothetical protein BN903_48 [Halorubrum sp. AJ67]|nr:hypothetical protein BN903_48 [Halorubrum sp. AJ67]